MNKRTTASLRGLAVFATAMAVAALVPTAAHAASNDTPANTESIPLVVERPSNVFVPFDLRQDGAVVTTAGFVRTFEEAAERAAVVTAPKVGETGKVVFENGTCLQAFGPSNSGWTIVSNSCDSARTTWTRTDSGALRLVGAPARSFESFGNADSITKRAFTGPDRPVGINAAR